MIDLEQARRLVREKLDEFERAHDYELVITTVHEEDFGWVFFYDSKKFKETQDIKYALAGNAPFIVDRKDGSLHDTGTTHPIEHYIERYKQQANSR